MNGGSMGPDARALLSAARFGDDPTADDADRVRAKIGARLAAGAAAGAATALATKTSAAKVAASAGAAGLGSKLAVAAIVVGATSATAAVAVHEELVAEAPHVAAAPVPATRISRAAPVVRALAPPTAPAPASASASAPAAASATASAPAPVRAARLPETDTLSEEAALLRRAREALARGDGAGALARVEEHASRFPGGALASEREAARVHALCTSGRPAEARAAASAFVAANARSPLAPSVRRACATND